MQNIDPNKAAQPASAPNTALLQQQLSSGANWFIWIAGLSLVNSIAALTGTQWSFALGLGITQIIDGLIMGLSHGNGGVAPLIGAFVIDLIIAGFYFGISVFAKKGFPWVFIVGMVLYALDGVISLMAQDMLSIALHGFALFCIWRGFNASRELKKHAASAVA